MRFIVFTLSALALTACNSSSGGDPDALPPGDADLSDGGLADAAAPTADAGPQTSCVPDDALPQPEFCVQDEDCRCGSHCALGACVAVCDTCADDEVCDGFGRCRDADGAAPIADHGTTGDLVPSIGQLRALPADSVPGVHLTAVGGPVTRARMVASGGVEVLCGDAYAAECLLSDPLAAGEAVPVQLRALEAFDGAGVLRVFTDRGVRAVRIGAEPDRLGRIGGIYTGVARQVDAQRAGLDVTVTVYPDGIVELVEPLGWLHGGDRMVGRIEGAEVVFPDAPWFGGDAYGVQTRLLARAQGRVEARPNPSHLLLSLDLQVIGVDDARLPALQWRIALDRAGDAPDASPTLPDEPEPPIDPATRSGWEAWMHAEALASDAAYDVEKAFAEAWGVQPNGRATGLILDLLFEGADVATYHTAQVEFPAGLPTAIDDVGDLIPCVVELEASAIELPLSQGGEACAPSRDLAIPPTTIDICAAVAENYGCDLIDVDGAFDAAIRPRISQRDPTCRYEALRGAALPMRGRIQRACAGPRLPLYAVEDVICFDEGRTSPLGQDTLPNGDMQCLETPLAVGLRVDQGTLPRAAERLESCLRDLSTARRVNGRSPAGDCLDVARMMTALGTGADRVVRRDDSRYSRLISGDGNAQLLHRMAQRWIELHGFIAREGVEAVQLEGILQGQGEAGPSDATRMLATAVRGWLPLLNARVGEGLVRLDRETLAQPDYRPFFGNRNLALDIDPRPRPSPDPTVETQQFGLPVSIMETLIAQVELADAALARGHRVGDERMLQTVAELARQADVLRLIARHQYARSDDGERVAGWADRYLADEAALITALNRLQHRAEAVLDGHDALGIAPTDQPIFSSAAAIRDGGGFAMTSDYLLGIGGDPLALVPERIATAEAAIDAARTAWLARQDRELDVRRSQRDADQGAEDLARSYGNTLAQYCGQPAGHDPQTMITDWPEFTPDTCFIDQTNNRCALSDTIWLQAAKIDALHGAVCRLNILDIYGAHLEGADPDFEQMVKAGCDTVEKTQCDDGRRNCLRCEASDGQVFVAPVRRSVVERGLAAPVTAAVARMVNASCSDALLPSNAELLGAPFNRPECYRGSIGEQVLAAESALREVQVVGGRYEERRSRYNIAMKSCLIAVNIDRAVETTDDDYREWQDKYGDVNTAASMLGGVATCIGSLGTSCVGVLDSIGGVATAEVQKLQREHDAAVTELRDSGVELTCFNDARQLLVGARTDVIAITVALEKATEALGHLHTLKASARSTYEAGRAAVNAWDDRQVVPPARDYWLDEAVSSYANAMIHARRVTYLAARALEYEYQLSMGGAAAALAASIPSDLRGVMEDLRDAAAVRQIARRSPSPLTGVLSLRDDILKLGDTTTAPDGMHQLDPTQRLRALLQAPRHAVFDVDGAYLGQRLPFELRPEHAADGQAAVFAQDRCAERLMGVNAAIVGGARATRTDLDIEQADAFYSQWCDDRAGFQHAGVDHTRDPFGQGTRGPNRAGTPARVQAGAGVDLFDPAYTSGQSLELAGRGLFGRYSVFIPAGAVDLDRVEDLELRFDYLSVAR